MTIRLALLHGVAVRRARLRALAGPGLAARDSSKRPVPDRPPVHAPRQRGHAAGLPAKIPHFLPIPVPGRPIRHATRLPDPTRPHDAHDADAPSHDLVYGPDDRPAAPVAFLAALQHLLAILVPIVTPGLLICQALGVSSRDTTLIVSMSLVISGIATYVQCKRFGPLGAGLLIVQGTSFNFVGPLIAGGS